MNLDKLTFFPFICIFITSGTYLFIEYSRDKAS